ncbi:cell surface metalloreductase [Aspergillus niger]|nr:cell surface metalloreductase [Aspergillus niger]
MVQDQQFSFPLDESRNMFTLIGAASLGILALCTNACLRRWSFEVFLRGHQILTATFVYGTLRHLSNENASSKLYLWVALGILGLTTCLQLVILLYRNGLFAGRGAPRALVSFTFKKTKEDKLVVTASQVRVLLPRPVQVEAGQYINLWIPSVGLWAWTQTHPFTVTSWSRHRQDAMELLVQPRRGLSADLTRHASAATETSVSYMALFTGPHGTTEDVSRYENALLIASGFGIAANRLVSALCSYSCKYPANEPDMTNAAQGLLNDLLDDDIIDDGYILNVSIYVRNGLAHNKVPFGEHERFCLYQGTPNYESIVSLEASGDQIERLPNIREERGRTLVVVSAGDDIRDQIREIIREDYHQGVHLSELEYQPNDG